MLLYSVTISLSAFLLFALQPIIAKIILPWFGGTSAVWSTCMLFFQVVLLLGYLYAHWLNRTFAPKRQVLIHGAVLAASLAMLPVLPNPAWRSPVGGNPSFRILALLTVTVGLPYFLLSSTSPLLQAWYARTHKGGMPYRLFALSNAASLTALLSYPFLVEPNLTSRLQAFVWSTAYAAFAAVCGLTAWRASLRPQVEPERPAGERAADDAVARTTRLLWFGLAATASVLLLAVTTHLTQDVAAIPFLWILPLTVYLLTFIICFEAPQLYHRAVFAPLLLLSLAFMAYRLWPERQNVEIPWLMPITRMGIQSALVAFAMALFACCMVCHGELARLKPHPRHLTGFYVIVSLGGAAGGLFVGLAAPNFFRAYYEFPIGLALCAALSVLVFARDVPRWALAPLGVLLLGYLSFIGVSMHQMVDGYLVATRNFYGQLRVYDSGDPRFDEDASRHLVHGLINHGEQMLREEYRRRPVTYFCPQSGIGLAMTALEGAPRRIGILGLGCGTLAAYGRAGDVLRIYEINQQVVDIANTQFSFLRDTAARVEVAVGDGRLVLESEPSQKFDILVMDAFSGDSVPVHLITREAFRTYFRHLKPGGILAVNISNRYLRLDPVMERAATAFGKLAMVYPFTASEDDSFCFSCSWALIMDRQTAAAHPDLQSRGVLLQARPDFPIWTDDFSNMFRILK